MVHRLEAMLFVLFDLGQAMRPHLGDRFIKLAPRGLGAQLAYPPPPRPPPPAAPPPPPPPPQKKCPRVPSASSSHGEMFRLARPGLLIPESYAAIRAGRCDR